MTSFVSSLQPQMLVPPVELTRAQRFGLAGLVLIVHAVAAGVFWYYTPRPTQVTEAAPITVSLITDAVPSQMRQPPVVRPAPIKPVSMVPPRPARPIAHAAPPLLAAPSPAMTQALQVPVVPPELPRPVVPTAQPATTQTVPATQAAPTAPTSAAPATQGNRASVQPRMLPSSAVRYLVEPTLSYPRVSRELGEQGVVRLKVLVDEQGRPRDIEVARSSGYPRLDQQAVQAMKKARFQPHIEEGEARPVWVLAPLTFNLED